jgi:pilus assembly protein Flp/PilA
MFESVQEFGRRIAVAVHSLFADRDGATALEYGVLAGLICVVIITAVTTLGTDLTAVFSNISAKLGPAKTTG